MIVQAVEDQEEEPQVPDTFVFENALHGDLERDVNGFSAVVRPKSDLSRKTREERRLDQRDRSIIQVLLRLNVGKQLVNFFFYFLGIIFIPLVTAFDFQTLVRTIWKEAAVEGLVHPVDQSTNFPVVPVGLFEVLQPVVEEGVDPGEGKHHYTDSEHEAKKHEEEEAKEGEYEAPSSHHTHQC